MNKVNLFMTTYSVEDAKMITEALSKAIKVAESIGNDAEIELKLLENRTVVATTISYEIKKEA